MPTTLGGDFTAQIGDWANQTQQRALAVLKDAAQTVSNEMRKPKKRGGNMPVDTGNLRRSLMASTEAMPSVADSKTKFDQDPGREITLTIAKMKAGDILYFGFQAAYAGIQENLNGFVRLTAQRWPQIVAASAKKMQDRVEARAARGSQ